MAHIIPNETPQEITLKDEPTPAEIADDAACELVKRDAAFAENWLENNQWNERWDEVDLLYDSPKTLAYWEQVTVESPSMTRYIVASHVNSIHPQLMEGLFLDAQPFMCRQRPGTTETTVTARATVLNYQLTDMEFENEVDQGLFQTILHGTGIWKWGVREEEVPDFSYTRKEEPLTTQNAIGATITLATEDSDTFDEEIKYKTIRRAFFENKELRSVLVDPKCKVHDIRKAGYVIDKSYATLSELLEMKKDPAYTLPDEATIRSWFEAPKENPAVLGTLDTGSSGTPSLGGQGLPDQERTTEDPSEQGLMILERWDNHKVITTLNNKKTIQNRENPYGVIPFYSTVWYARMRAFLGLGVGRLVGQDQRLAAGLTNSGLGLLQLLLDPPFVVNSDENAFSQNLRFRKGAFIKVKGDPRTAIMPLEMPKLPVGEIFAFLQNSQQSAESADGANEMLVQGGISGTGGKSSLTRSSAGAQAFAGASSGRLQGPLDRFVRYVFIPWLYQLDELNRRGLIPMKQIKEILSEELGEAYELDQKNFVTGRVQFDVLAATRMAAKRVMAQSLPLITQIFGNPQLLAQLRQDGFYVDVKEIFTMWMQSSGWPNQYDLIKKLTPEMKAAQQGPANPEAAKSAADAGKEDQKFQHQKELLQQKGEQGIVRDALSASFDKAGDEVLRQSVEKAATPEAVTGEPGGNFGE